MVCALSAPGPVPGESAESIGCDEDGFASVLAALVGATTPDPSNQVVPGSVAPVESAEILGDLTAESGATDWRRVGVGEDEIPPPGIVGVPSSDRTDTTVHDAPVRAVLELRSEVTGRGLDTQAARWSDPPGPVNEAREPAQDGRTVSAMVAPIMGDVGHAVLESLVADRTEAVAADLAEGTVPLAESESDVSQPPPSDSPSGDRNPAADAWGSPIDRDSAPDAHLDDRSSIAVEETVGSDVADDVRPLGPPARVEPSTDRVSLPDSQADVHSTSNAVADPMTGARIEARVASIREVAEWLEGVGLESTPGEMRIEIPDGEGELVVRVTFVNGRLEVDASGSEGSLPERWLDDLRRELEARNFDLAGHRQRREGRSGRGDESGAPADAHTSRRDRDPRPGVLL